MINMKTSAIGVVAILIFLIAANGVSYAAGADSDAIKRLRALDGKPFFAREADKVRLTWDIVPDAVMYQVVLLKNEKDTADNIVLTVNQIFTNGAEIELTKFGDERKNFFYKVCPLNAECNPIRPFSAPKPITEGEFNTLSPLPTSEFDKMKFAPLYPTYSWIPFLNAAKYQIQVFRKGADDILVSNIIAEEHDAYEWSGYTYPGEYYWRLRALNSDGRTMSDWSDKRYFTVVAPVTTASYGDSITHGGGATGVSPCITMYNYETYAHVPIKNLGKSGDTTSMMRERFTTDVLPFSPKILVIMGGVNDYRQGISAYTTIDNLEAIGEMCRQNGIIPVFVTPTPINGWLIERRKLASPPYYGWQHSRNVVIEWIKEQRYHIDLGSILEDRDGDLDGKYSSDGLHPDYEGKKYIGNTIGNYLVKTFSDIYSD